MEAEPTATMSEPPKTDTLSDEARKRRRRETQRRYRLAHADECKRRISEWKARNKDRVLAINRKAHHANLEKNHARSREWRVNNPERKSELARLWFAENIERVREKSRVWRDKNKDKRSESGKRWRAANPEREKELKRRWREANVDKNREKSMAYRAGKGRATPQWLTKAQRLEIRRVYSLAVRDDLVVDHIVPLRGRNVCGLHVPWNLQLLTREENSRKHNRFD